MKIEIKEQNTFEKFLFLDDIRMPNDAFAHTQKEMFISLHWEIVRSYSEFVDWILQNGLPKLISFDHDLADLPNLSNQGKPDSVDAEIPFEKTGYDCAKWLIDYCLDRDLICPKYFCHSMNPVGKDKINSVLAQFSNLQSNQNLRRI